MDDSAKVPAEPNSNNVAVDTAAAADPASGGAEQQGGAAATQKAAPMDIDDSASDDDGDDDVAKVADPQGSDGKKKNNSDDHDDSASDSDSDDGSQVVAGKKKAMPRVKKSSLFEDEASEDDDEDGGEGGSEDDEEGEEGDDGIYKEMKGFIVPEDGGNKSRKRKKREDDSASDSDEDEDDEDDEPQFKRLKKARRDITGDDDDLKLIEENKRLQQGEDYPPPPVVDEEANEKKKKKKKKKRSVVDEEMQGFIEDDSDSESESESSDDDDNNVTDMYNEDDWKNLRLMKELFVMTEDPWLRAIKAAKGLYDPKADEEQEVDEGQTDFHIDAGRDEISKNLAILREQYEPSERARHFVTEFDDKIRREDKPERLYIRNLQKGRTNIDWDDIEEVKTERGLEATWIFYKLKAENMLLNPDVHETKRLAVSCITKVLSFVYDKEYQYEIPFIWNYRRDYFCYNNKFILDEQALWRVYDLDISWTRLRSRWHELANVMTKLKTIIDKEEEELADKRNDVDSEMQKAGVSSSHDAQKAMAENNGTVTSSSAPIDSTSTTAPSDASVGGAVDLTGETGHEKIAELNAKSSIELQRKESKALLEKYLAELNRVHQDRDFVKDFNEAKLKDIQNCILLHFPELTSESKRKRGATKKSAYSKILKANALPLLREVGGLSAEKYGENVMQEEKVHEQVIATSDMQKLHEQWGNGLFSSEKDVWKAIENAIAIELQCEPQLKSHIRQYVKENAFLSSEPTRKGWIMFNETDTGHDCVPIQYIEPRKLATFKSAERLPSDMNVVPHDVTRLCGYEAYLLLNRAVKEGLVTKKVFLEKEDEESLFLHLAGFIVSDTFANDESAENQLVDAWQKDGIQIDDLVNRTRVQALKKSVIKLVKLALDELQREATKSAIEYVAKESAISLGKKLMMKPLREDLQEHALDAIAIADRKARVPLYNMENEGEYDDRPEDKRNNAGRRAVFYVGSGGRYSINVAVALNEAGDCIDSVNLPEMNQRNRTEMKDQIEQFISVHLPKICLVSSSGGLDSKRMLHMVQDATRAREEIMCRNAKIEIPPDRRSDFSSNYNYFFKVMTVSNKAAMLYAKRVHKVDERIREFHVNARTAIAIGRQTIDPLSFYAALWEEPWIVEANKRGSHSVNCSENPGGNVLLLNLHPFQNEVSKEVLATYLEREFLKATAITGVDLNRAIDSPHWAETLRFVPGLGERKAVALRQSLPKLVRSSTNQGHSNTSSWQDEEAEAAFDANSYLRSRSLLTFENGGPLKPNVYTNAAGYLRIGSIDQFSQTQEQDADYGADNTRKYPEPLDVTRIHPADYLDTKVIVARACEVSGDIKDISSEAMSQFVRSMLLNVEKVKDADGVIENRSDNDALKRHQGNLNSYNVLQNAAKMQLEKGLEFTPFNLLEDIKHELCHKVPEKRMIGFSELSQEEKFYLYTGMTPATLREGKSLHAKVINDRDRVKVRLECMVTGFLDNLDTKVTEDEIVEVVVSKLYFNSFSALFSAKTSYNKAATLYPLYTYDTMNMMKLNNAEWKFGYGQAMIAAPMPEILKKERDALMKKNAKSSKPKYVRRQIAHEAFKNLRGLEEAKTYLKDKPIGDRILRPSSNGKRFLTLTWKVSDTIYAHNEIEEKVSESGEKTFTVLGWDDEYSEIDELLDRYYNPVQELVTTLQQHEKYKEGDRKSATQYLLERHSENPKRKHYIMRPVEKRPGCFEILHTQSFRNSVPFRVTPDGYRVFGKEYQSIPHMIQFFKRAIQTGKLTKLKEEYQKEQEKKALERKRNKEKMFEERRRREQEQHRQSYTSNRPRGDGNRIGGQSRDNNWGSYGGGSYNSSSNWGRPDAGARQYNPNNDYLGGGGYDRRGAGQNYGGGYDNGWSNDRRGGYGNAAPRQDAYSVASGGSNFPPRSDRYSSNNNNYYNNSGRGYN